MSASVPTVQESTPTGEGSTRYVFVSYMRKDWTIVDDIVTELRAAGATVWLDRENLLPGTFWRTAIRAAVEKGAFFLACFSDSREERDATFLNAELLLAVDVLRQRAHDRAWFIPAILTPCDVPALEIGGGMTLRDLTHVALHENWDEGIQRIVDVVVDRSSSRSTRMPVPRPAGMRGPSTTTRLEAEDVHIRSDLTVANVEGAVSPPTDHATSEHRFGKLVVDGSVTLVNRRA